MLEYEDLKRVNAEFIPEFHAAFDSVLSSGWFILGENVAAFESEFASFNSVRFCAGVASGLDALTISLLALDLPPKSEILVPSNTYIATILSILHCGHVPVLIEPDIGTYNIDPDLIERSVTPRARALLIVHLYGKTCKMDDIVSICRKRNLFLIEDCAQAHGAEYKGRKAGSFGDLSAFSFYPTKNLGCLGDGGAVLSDNEDLIKKVRMIRNYGSEKKYYNEVIGLNSRLDELQAAFLRIKLKQLNKINNHKRILAKKYLSGLNDSFIKPRLQEDHSDVYHIFNIRHERRDELKQFLFDNGIKTEIHYPVPPHQQKALIGMNSVRFPISEEIHRSTLSLPISSFHTAEDVEFIVSVLNHFE